MRGLMAAATPFGPVSHNPIGQSLLEADVVSDFLRLNPLVSQDLFPLRLELAVKGRVLHQFCVAGSVWHIAHERRASD